MTSTGLSLRRRNLARVAVPKMPIPNIGYVAYVHDPEGNILGIYQEDASAA